MQFSVKVRDQRIAAINEQQDKINEKMFELMELGKDIESAMKAAVTGYSNGVEQLKELSSNDLSTLCNQ